MRVSRSENEPDAAKVERDRLLFPEREIGE